ncbi:MAG: SpoIIE family protein phosphatase [Acidobacteria bacterium]|nr:SpoIIE family protein phosphatase [Acidobacteriota bacterium]MBI3426284.1 SpoIIE family protein phosphatase [Acidobacteriota bacterium]
MPRLIVRVSPSGGDSVAELNRSRITIGRSARNDLCVEDPFASRLHAEVRSRGDSFWLSDLGSANGTLLNDVRMTVPVMLKDGDVIRIGETAIEFNDRADTTRTKGRTQILLADSYTPSETEVTIAGTVSNSQANLLTTIDSSHQTLIAQAIQQPISQPSAQIITQQDDTLALISRVSVTLLTPLSLDDTLSQVLDCVFQAIRADRGYVMLLETPEGKKNEPAKIGAAELVCKAQKTSGGDNSTEVSLSRSITEQVLQQRKALLTSDAQHDPRFAANQSIMLGGIRSIMAVPLAIEERVLGMVYVDSPLHSNRFTKRDLELLTLIAGVAAIRIENVRLLDVQAEQKRLANELAVASEIQLRLHPAAPPAINGYDLMGVSFPCYEVGGDYYDFIQKRDGRIVIALGDVSGKGTGAALLMSSIHAAVRAQCTTRLAPSEIVTEINQYIYDNTPSNRYVTLFYSELDPRTHQLTYINGGHNSPLLVRTSGEITTLDIGGFPVGITPFGDYHEGMAHLEPGDVLVIYSDGVTESQDEAGEEFGEARLIEIVQRNRGRTAAGLRDRIDDALQKFVGKAKSVDDLTLVILKRKSLE